jgi:Rps23 Pro-64 3,4-dihydroxylase Tpa1-like proline 4-hydroxylase|tara:strand:- start:1958 stop:2545 length:588 start_codon:yes stop_codon:yes gene_type:complete
MITYTFGNNLSKVYKQSKFFNRETCQTLINFHKENVDLSAWNPKDDYWNNRIIHLHRTDNQEILDILWYIKTTVEGLILQYTGIPEIYLEQADIQWWGDGMHMPVHYDNCNHDGSPMDGCWFRTMTGVIYLNDDYDNGNLIFPHHKFEIKPKMGDLVFFSSDFDCLHGIDTVTNGERFTVPMWYTKYADKQLILT